jgi:hypothetical protein
MNEIKIDGKTAEQKADDIVEMVQSEINKNGFLTATDIAEIVQAEKYMALQAPFAYNEDFESEILEILSNRNRKLKN